MLFEKKREEMGRRKIPMWDIHYVALIRRGVPIEQGIGRKKKMP